MTSRTPWEEPCPRCKTGTSTHNENGTIYCSNQNCVDFPYITEGNRHFFEKPRQDDLGDSNRF